MSSKRITTKYVGVYERISDERTYNGKPDVAYDITYKTDGKKIWEKVGWQSEGYSAKLAEQVRGDRIRTIRHNEELPQQKKKAPIFKEVAGKYLQWAQENHCRNGKDDISRYEHLKRFESKRMDEISAFNLEKLKSDLLKQGLAGASVKHVLVLFRMIWNKGLAWGMFKGECPIKQVKMPVLQNERERFLSFDEANLLLERLKQSSELVHDMALLSLHLGLRFGEIVALRGIDVDFNNGTILVADPKNKKSRKAYLTESVKVMLQGRIPPKKEDLIFFAGGKQKKHIAHISATFVRVVKELAFNNGITDRRQWISFHSLRHTHASWLALSGESLLVIKESLGHSDLSMVKRYAHIGQDTRKQAATRLETAFNQSKENSIFSLSKNK